MTRAAGLCLVFSIALTGGTVATSAALTGCDTGEYGSAGGSGCCKVCSTGKACGDSCIARSNTCRVGAGCACNG